MVSKRLVRDLFRVFFRRWKRGWSPEWSAPKPRPPRPVVTPVKRVECDLKEEVEEGLGPYESLLGAVRRRNAVSKRPVFTQIHLESKASDARNGQDGLHDEARAPFQASTASC